MEPKFDELLPVRTFIFIFAKSDNWLKPATSYLMKKVIPDLAVTLDGFIEGPNGEIDW